MATNNDPKSNAGEVSDADAEDLPSDFFDDFAKDEFMEGLSVIDSWDDKPRSGNNSIADQDTEIMGGKYEDTHLQRSPSSKPKPERKIPSSSIDEMDSYIMPGSRRDPKKTIEAIKKDKETKVKEILTKHLTDSEELRPPGTELDDYYSDKKPTETRKSQGNLKQEKHEEFSHIQPTVRDRGDNYEGSPPKHFKNSYHFSRNNRHRDYLPDSPGRRIRPQFSPKRYTYRHHYSPRRSPPSRSPRRYHNNSTFYKDVKRYYSPHRRSPRRHSPMRRSSRSPRQSRRSRSPYERSHASRYSHSPSPKRDKSYYSNEEKRIYSSPKNTSYQPDNRPQYTESILGEYPGNIAGYSYNVAYNAGASAVQYNTPYNYGMTPQAGVMPAPLPVPAPVVNPQAPPMVPAPNVAIQQPATMQLQQPAEVKTPYDALAQLVAEGKISKEDYMKLAPNKGVSIPTEKINMSAVLGRCNHAVQKLSKLLLPNRLLMNKNIRPEPKPLVAKFCSPLKRQGAMTFHFTSLSESVTAQQNKQLVDSIIATIGLDKVVTRDSHHQKRTPKNMKDAGTQTTNPYCIVCEVRNATKHVSVSTSIDNDHFSLTAQTQVAEEDLSGIKSIFNPSGSVAEGPVSISHFTPAQLVSQLAARAKTFRRAAPSPSPSNYDRRNEQNYDYDPRYNQSTYHNNYNYRY